MDFQEVPREESGSCSFGATLQKDPSCNSPCSWAAADPSSFLIRGESYLRDNQKVSYLFFSSGYENLIERKDFESSADPGLIGNALLVPFTLDENGDIL